MSLVQANVQFDAGENHKYWQAIVEGLCKGEVGVKLQERVDVFGEKPAELLENLLEEHEGILLQAAGYELNGARISIHFEWPTGLESFVQDLKVFLLSCGLTGLQITGTDWTSD
jgi:hypothetical protein